MIDDDLVAAVRTQGGLDSARNGLAGLDVPDNGSILGVVAALTENSLAGFAPTYVVDFRSLPLRADKEVGLMAWLFLTSGIPA